MTCFSFANVLRARKFFWICDTMWVGPLMRRFGPRCREAWFVWRFRVPRNDGEDEEETESKRGAEKRSRPIRNRSLLRGSSAVSALVVHVGDERAPSRRQTPGNELRKPGLRIARPRRKEVKSALQVAVPRSSRLRPSLNIRVRSGGAQDTRSWAALVKSCAPRDSQDLYQMISATWLEKAT